MRYYKNLEAFKENKFSTFLPGSSVTGVLYNEFGLWVTTLENGIFYCPNLNTKIYNSNIGLPVDFVNTIAFDDRDNIYTGLSNGEIWLLNLSNEKASNIYTPNKNNHTTALHDLFFDIENNVLWSDYFGHENMLTKNGLKNEWQVVHNSVGGKKYFFDDDSKKLWNVRVTGFFKINTELKFVEWRSKNVLPLNRNAKLSPDKYTLEIQAQNEDKKWSKSLEYPFQISKPFGQTIGFKLACILGFCFFFTFIYRSCLELIN